MTALAHVAEVLTAPEQDMLPYAYTPYATLGKLDIQATRQA